MKSNEVLISWAKHVSTEKLIHISDAQDADRPNFQCPGCKRKLELVHRKKPNIIDFYRHSIHSECAGKPESELHLLAKAIVERNNDILLSPNKNFQYQHARLEKWLEEQIRPDVIISDHNNMEWLIEIAVSNPVTEAKLYKIQNANRNALQITMCASDWELPLAQIEHKVLRDPETRKILHPIPEKPISTNSSQNQSCLVGLVMLVIGLLFVAWINGNR